MKYIRVRNAEGIDMMAELLSTEEGYSPEEYADAMKSMLEIKPDDLFIIQVYDGDEIQALLIATAPPRVNHVFIMQVTILDSAGENKTLSKQLFYRVLLWAENKGRTELRFETRRDPQGFEKKWGFKHFSEVMSFSIPEDVEELILSGDQDKIMGSDDSSPDELSKDPEKAASEATDGKGD